MTDKPKPRASSASSGTRRGNGAGWGGPAKGAPPRADTAPTFEPGNQAAKGYHDMSKSQRLDALAERKWMIAMGMTDAEPVAIAAANSYENRELGLPVARNVNTDDVTVRAVISDKPLTADEWSAQYGAGMGAADRASESAG